MQAGPNLSNKLIPREAYYFFPKDEQFLVTSTDKIRIIFGGKIQLTTEEIQKVHEFKESAKTKPEAVHLLDPMYFFIKLDGQ